MANTRPKTEVPIDVEARLLQLLKDIENQTGLKYEINLHQFGCHNNRGLKIGDFKHRKNYRVYNAQPNYKKLEGTFAIYDEMVIHINKCRFSFALDTKVTQLGGGEYITWQCPGCNAWGSKAGAGNFDSTCQNCHKWYQYCESFGIDMYTGNIFTSSGGSVSVCSNVASISFD